MSPGWLDVMSGRSEGEGLLLVSNGCTSSGHNAHIGHIRLVTHRGFSNLLMPVFLQPWRLMMMPVTSFPSALAMIHSSFSLFYKMCRWPAKLLENEAGRPQMVYFFGIKKFAKVNKSNFHPFTDEGAMAMLMSLPRSKKRALKVALQEARAELTLQPELAAFDKWANCVLNFNHGSQPQRGKGAGSSSPELDQAESHRLRQDGEACTLSREEPLPHDVIMRQIEEMEHKEKAVNAVNAGPCSGSDDSLSDNLEFAELSEFETHTACELARVAKPPSPCERELLRLKMAYKMCADALGVSIIPKPHPKPLSSTCNRSSSFQHEDSDRDTFSDHWKLLMDFSAAAQEFCRAEDSGALQCSQCILANPCSW